MTMTFTMMSMTMMMATMAASGVVVPVKPGSSLIIWHPKPFPRLQWFLVCNIIFIIFPNTFDKNTKINQAWVCLRFWPVDKYIKVKDLQHQIYVNSSYIVNGIQGINKWESQMPSFHCTQIISTFWYLTSLNKSKVGNKG